MQTKIFIERLKVELLKRAEQRFPDEALGPAGDKNSLAECYTIDKMGEGFNVLMLWYNVGKETHVETVVFDHATAEELESGGKENDRQKDR